jgi:hypothetical protein
MTMSRNTISCHESRLYASLHPARRLLPFRACG